MDNFLIKQETYLEAGIHIGTKIKVVDMNQFIYRMRNDGLYVLDLRKIDERIRLAGKLLSQYPPEDILVVASRTYSGNAASVFSELTGIKVLQGRFIPGILTNVHRKDFLEPKLLLVCDPKGERQAVIEAGKMGIATIGLCDSDNSTSFIDWVVPCNNKGRRSLALIFYLLSREYLMGRNKISSYDEFTVPLSRFEAEKPEEEAGASVQPSQEAQQQPEAALEPQEEGSQEGQPAGKKEEASAKKERKSSKRKEKPAEKEQESN
ncbi:MAG: 30S ribosomal protein S2 [Candidatus Micrarchaeota archaeon]|nr:30S ribosomal protein S2 [Candidatus Micrarchaeota archaeon]